MPNGGQSVGDWSLGEVALDKQLSSLLLRSQIAMSGVFALLARWGYWDACIIWQSPGGLKRRSQNGAVG